MPLPALPVMTLSVMNSPAGAPFYMLPTVGGSGTNRGFNYYRFRDQNAMVAQANQLPQQVLALLQR